MRSKVAVIVSLMFVLAVGGAALAVNTRILNTSPQPDIGRANELLLPSGAPPAATPPPVTTPAVLPAPTPAAPTSAGAPHRDDHHGAGEHATAEMADDERDD